MEALKSAISSGARTAEILAKTPPPDAFPPLQTGIAGELPLFATVVGIASVRNNFNTLVWAGLVARTEEVWAPGRRNPPSLAALMLDPYHVAFSTPSTEKLGLPDEL